MIRKTIRPNRARISTRKFHLIVSCFCDDLTAFGTGKIVKVNRHTVENYFNRFRHLIYLDSQKDKKLEGEIEIDEAYFGHKRRVAPGNQRKSTNRINNLYRWMDKL